MSFSRRLFVLLPFAFAGGQLFAPLAQAQVAAPPEAAKLNGQHPAAYYKAAAEMFGAGRKDEAVFIFYLGQLRYRVHLQARLPELKPDGDPALFGSLSETVGRPINQYAFGDLPALSKTIDAVLAWDSANPDSFTPPDRYAGVYNSTRNGLVQMRTQLLQQADSIRAQRKANGLENRN